MTKASCVDCCVGNGDYYFALRQVPSLVLRGYVASIHPSDSLTSFHQNSCSPARIWGCYHANGFCCPKFN